MDEKMEGDFVGISSFQYPLALHVGAYAQPLGPSAGRARLHEESKRWASLSLRNV